MKTTKLLAFLLAMLMLLSTFVACGSGKETEESETESLATETDTETEKETEKETETGPIQTGGQPTEPGVLVNLDFESTLGVPSYIASFKGLEANATLNGGTLLGGKWVYDGRPLAIKDGLGIYDLTAYRVEFDFCFNTFVNKLTSVFTFITDDDGVLNGESNFHMAFRMNPDGTIFHGSASAITFQVEQGKTYHFTAEINRNTNKISVYIDGQLLIAPNYSQEKRAYNCFRIMDNNRGADMWVDNFKITDIGAQLNASTDKIARAIDGAYTRAGDYADRVMDFSADGLLRVKRENLTYIGSYTRSALLKFDISKLDYDTVGYAPLNIQMYNTSAERIFNIFLIDSDWEGATVTHNTMPEGKLIAEGVKLGSAAIIDLAEVIREVLDDGEETLSLRIDAASVTEGETTIYYSDKQKPSITVYPFTSDKNYFEYLVEDEGKNDAIWAHAEQMFSEWYARYESLPAVNADAIRLPYNTKQYTKTNYSSGQSTNYANSKIANKSRPLSALGDYASLVSDEIKNAKRDVYGGLMVESMKQTATGYFYSKKIDGRWFLVDPLGYPYISIGLSDIHYSQLGSQLQKNNVIKAYGTYDAWAIATTRRVKDELFFNSSARPVEEIKKVKDGLPFIQPYSVMSSYGSMKGVRGDGNGSTVFTENNTMPVFDPDFESYANSWAKASIKYQDEKKLIGYTSDNELPMNTDMLDRSLTVNFTNEANHYTYACAWTFLKNMTDKDNPSLDDVTDELRDLFRGFVWDRYLYVVSSAIKAVDPNHMYMGTRFLTVSKDSEWVYRFAAQYLDCMTINWYTEWEPKEESLYGIARNGDMPFIVTEFYTKAGDSGLGNTSGAGRYVATQTDRADFYDTFTLRLLESQNCVGWQWFQYMDNDPNSGTGDKSSVDSNKGIFASDLSEYTVFTDRMKILNEDAYELIFYFINERQK